jgi:DNA-binding MarR family transcriptional regulator
VSAAGFSDCRYAAGLDVSQSRTLIALAEYGVLTGDNLANVLMLQRDIVEEILSGLTERGLLFRDAAGLVSLTQAGRELQEAVQTRWKRYEQEQLAQFTSPDVSVVRRFLATYIRRFGPRWQEH